MRILEIGAELGEYCGKILAGLGADVVRVEPRGGEVTRAYGPFRHDEAHPDRSLYFWHYNFGKRSVELDLDDPADQARFRSLALGCDVILDSRPRGYLDARGLGRAGLADRNPGLIHARISPFGDTGPWADHQASDLVHLALGGVSMNCGYDPDPAGEYDTPPMAPQIWQAYHVAGEMMAMSILAALIYRQTSGEGQSLSASVHQAVSQSTETDIPSWVFLRAVHRRLTCRHSATVARSPSLATTKDGRYVLPYRTYLMAGFNIWDDTVAVLRDHGMQADLEDPVYETTRDTPLARERLEFLTERLVSRLPFDRDIWLDAQRHGLPWAPVRRPEENMSDPHWCDRGAFFEVEHPELGERFQYSGAKWCSNDVEWRRGPRAPLVGEHNGIVPSEWRAPRVAPRAYANARMQAPAVTSKHGRPFALSDVRVIDLGWMLASAGAGRFLAAMGAQVIRVEHRSRPDGMRFSQAGAMPKGGRAEREAATAPIPAPVWAPNLNRSGCFMEINAGKLSCGLDLKNPDDKKILEDLIRDADMVVEGYSPGTLTRMGLGYERLKELNPRIIYVQQSGLGERGRYGRMRTFGPSAQAITGISEMSGLPEPYPPAGIGYSYLDWCGAYNMATAMLAALHRRNDTGLGCHIDASQGDAGLYLTSTATLDYSVNGRRWSRFGNRSPYKPAAPHGNYRAAGPDRWIAIAAFTEAHWSSVTAVLGLQALRNDARFASLADRLKHQDALDRLVGEATARFEPFALMDALQKAGVPAGVCQTAQDRCDSDPQLRHLGWQVELDQTEIGRWPVKEHPVQFSATPAYMGGRYDRSGPSYGEDTARVLRDILGLTRADAAG
ncbi:CoA transferase [Phenylobacterium sp.]|uniref:CaiB/BaiF CoA transferase family protein n=1 Tax=Phenylobacterium sp. TaxID=1871053 RepID=UPI0025EFD56E|nr:CoA transferase [Phenylobacterium sp.]MBX3485452.1 CoA transferase [Phenylobacterium sp.]